MIAVGDRVTLARTVGAAGPALRALVGRAGEVAEVRTVGGTTTVMVRFGPHWSAEPGTWWCKPEELDVIEDAQEGAEGVAGGAVAQPVDRGLDRSSDKKSATYTSAGEGER